MHAIVCARNARTQEQEILEAEHENAEAWAQRENEIEKLRQSERLYIFTCTLLLRVCFLFYHRNHLCLLRQYIAREAHK